MPLLCDELKFWKKFLQSSFLLWRRCLGDRFDGLNAKTTRTVTGLSFVGFRLGLKGFSRRRSPKPKNSGIYQLSVSVSFLIFLCLGEEEIYLKQPDKVRKAVVEKRFALSWASSISEKISSRHNVEAGTSFCSSP